jgi:hypothetical protein
VQIGNRGRSGLHTVCDPIHVFQNWAEAEAGVLELLPNMLISPRKGGGSTTRQQEPKISMDNA